MIIPPTRYKSKQELYTRMFLVSRDVKAVKMQARSQRYLEAALLDSGSVSLYNLLI